MRELSATSRLLGGTARLPAPIDRLAGRLTNRWLRATPRPDVDLMVALEESGFNHVAAPLVRWTWEGRDLGVVQEPLADRSAGWALALTSLRDPTTGEQGVNNVLIRHPDIVRSLRLLFDDEWSRAERITQR